MQYGNSSGGRTVVKVTYPIAFLSAYAVSCSILGGNNANADISKIIEWKLQYFQYINTQGSSGFNADSKYIAIGY